MSHMKLVKSGTNQMNIVVNGVKRVNIVWNGERASVLLTEAFGCDDNTWIRMKVLIDEAVRDFCGGGKIVELVEKKRALDKECRELEDKYDHNRATIRELDETIKRIRNGEINDFGPFECENCDDQGMTQEQVEIINYLKNIGYGWGKFARSVEESGKCSTAQYETMIRMKQRIRDQASANRCKFRSHYGDPDISDCEAMRSGDFF